MTDQPVLLAIADGVARITLNNPERRNAVDARTAEEFARCTREAANDPSVRVIVLAAAGTYFSPGGDISGFLADEDNIGRHVALLTDRIHAGIRYLASAPAPVVVALNGMAAGGGLGMALCGDYIVAGRSARLNCAYTRSGLTPDAGTTWFLARRLSHARAFEIAALNDTLTAEQASALGLINMVVDDPDLEQEVDAVVARFLAMPEGVLGATKRLLHAAQTTTLESHLESEAQGIIARVRLPSTLAMLRRFLKR